MEKDDSIETPVTSSAIELRVNGKLMAKNELTVGCNFSNSNIGSLHVNYDNSVHNHYHSSTEHKSIASSTYLGASSFLLDDTKETAVTSSAIEHLVNESLLNPLRIVFDMMCCRIKDWRRFANTLGVDYLIRDLVENEQYNDVHEKINQCIHERRETSVDADPDWLYWRHVLLQIDADDLVDAIEDAYPKLLEDDRIDLSNTVHKALEDFGIVAHNATKRELFEKLPHKLKDKIEICVGAGNRNTYAVKKVKDMSTIQDKYFEKYKMLEEIKIYDFSSIGKREECKILQTMHAWLQKNNDNGFCVKGYDVKQHAQYFCEGYSNLTPYKDSYILTYSANNNVIFYIDTEPEEIKKSMRDNLLNIRHLTTTNQCLHGNPFVYIPVTLCDINQLKLLNQTICKTCVDLQLVASVETFKDLDSFEKWWQAMSVEVKDITDEQKDKTEISIEFFKSIIGFMAVAPFDLPNFTSSPDKEIQEAQKLILLTPEQQNIIYSNIKRKIIKGSFGSGKTIAAQQLIKLLVGNVSDFEFVYYICHDNNSAYIHEMEKLVKTFKRENVIACTISDLTGGENKSLSLVFQYLLQKHKSSTVHVCIEEFNAEILDEEEVDKITSLLKKETFGNSHIVLVCQSMESYRCQIQGKSRLHYDKYQFEKLSQQALFKIFDLSYLLRSSLHINNIIDAAIPILNKAVWNSFVPQPAIAIAQQSITYDADDRFTSTSLPIGKNSEEPFQHLPNKTSEKLEASSSSSDLKNSADLSNPLQRNSMLDSSSSSNDTLSSQSTVTKASSIKRSYVKINDTDKILKHISARSYRYEKLMELESSYKFVGKRDTGHTVKGKKPFLYYPFKNQESKNIIFKVSNNFKKKFKRGNQSYSYQIFCLSRALTRIKLNNQGKDIHAIIYMNDESKTAVRHALAGSKYKWTEDPQLLSTGEFDFLLTDYTSVRGCEFLNVVLIYSVDEEHLKHNLIDCISRCKLNLVVMIISNGGIPDKTLVKILAEWKKRNLVEIMEGDYLKNITQEEMNVFNKNLEHLLFGYPNVAYFDYSDVTGIQKIFNKQQFDNMMKKMPGTVETPVSEGISQDIWNISKRGESSNNVLLLFDALKNNNLNINSIYKFYEYHTPASLLHRAVLEDDFSIIKFLTGMNIDVNIKDGIGWTPLHDAARYNTYDLVKVVSKADGDIPSTVVRNHIDTVKLLLQEDKINVNSTENKNGNTPLHLAIIFNNIAIVKLLLHHKNIDANVVNSEGDTPLLVATWYNHVDIVNLLLQEDKVDRNIKNNEGITPLDIATRKEYDSIIKLFKN